MSILPRTGTASARYAVGETNYFGGICACAETVTREIVLNLSVRNVMPGSGSSCEPKRTSAYSEDLRWRMVWERECLLGKKCSDVAVT